MKQIVCLATSPWYPIPTRKQQVMSRIPDAEILYFDPSATIIAPLRDKTAKPLMTAWKQPGEKVKDNITVYRLPPVLPFFNKCRAINRVNQKNIAKFVREKMKEHGFEKPLLWVYSPVTVDCVDLIPHSGLVYDCVDRHSAYGGLMNPGARRRDGAGARGEDRYDVRNGKVPCRTPAKGAAGGKIYPEWRELRALF